MPSSPPDPVLRELASPGLVDLAPRRWLVKGQELGRQGEPCENLYIIAAGQVLLSRRGKNDESHALYLLGCGELFGEGSLRAERRWLVDVRAVTDAQVHVLPAAHLPRLAQFYPQLTAHLLALLGARLERAHARLDLVAAESARERVLSLLHALAAYHGESDGAAVWVPLTLTQAELGNMINLARETVARTLSELESEGIIRRQRRRGLWLLSPTRM